MINIFLLLGVERFPWWTIYQLMHLGHFYLIRNSHSCKVGLATVFEDYLPFHIDKADAGHDTTWQQSHRISLDLEKQIKIFCF